MPQSARSGKSHAGSRALHLWFLRQVADAVKAGKGEAQDCRPGIIGITCASPDQNGRVLASVPRLHLQILRKLPCPELPRSAYLQHHDDGVEVRYGFQTTQVKAVIKATSATTNIHDGMEGTELQNRFSPAEC